MRISVLLFCTGVLALCLVLVLLATPARTGERAEASPPAAKSAVVRAQAGDAADRPFASGRVPAEVVSTTAGLLQQIQAGLNSDNPGDQAAVFTNQFLALIRYDPWAAARFAESPEAGIWHAELMRVLAQNWAKLNPWDAAKWVSQIASADEQDTMLACVCFQVAQANPVLAIQTLEQQGISNERREIMLGNLAQQWAGQDLPQAANWAGDFPPGETRDGLFLQIATAESKTSPLAAAQMAAYQIAPGSTQQAAVLSILYQWALQDMPSAIAWAGQFPAGEVSDRAQNELARVAENQNAGASEELPRPQ